MRTLLVALAVLALSTGTAAFAREHFQVYEGPDAVRTGTGGARETKNGIDYWTTGTPPRQYKVIGLLIDKRGSGILSGDPVGSKSVAYTVKAQGGDAVIIGDEEEKTIGFVGSGTSFGYGQTRTMFGGARAVVKRKTMMLVVKYLDAGHQ